jgi:hypothetical protein
MWKPQPLATLRASTACTGKTLRFTLSNINTHKRIKDYYFYIVSTLGLSVKRSFKLLKSMSISKFCGWPHTETNLVDHVRDLHTTWVLTLHTVELPSTCPCLFVLRKRNPHSHWIGDWMSQQSRSWRCAEEKNSDTAENRTINPPIVQPGA